MGRRPAYVYTYCVLEVVRRVVCRGGRGGRHMVYDDVNHEEHPPPVKLVAELPEISGSTEAVVELADVGDPVAMVRVAVRRPRAVVVLVDGADPDRSEAHRLDVVQVGSDRFPGTPAKCLFRDVTGGGLGERRRQSEAICDDPVQRRKG